MPYIGFEPTASDTISVFKYVATSSQTTFTGADAGGATLSYDVGDGSCQVWLNGVRLDSADITAANGTSVVLAACTTGDIVHIQATKAFIPADVVPKAAGGTFDGAVVAGAGATVPSGQTLTIASGATIANSGTATGFGGDLSFGGDTFGANKVIGSNDAYSLSLETNGTTAMTISTAGEITTPLNPAFKASGGSVSNVTGDGTLYQIVFGTEIYDTNGDHADGVFTAPVSGNYFFHATVFCMQVDTAHTLAYMQFIASDGGTDDVRVMYESPANSFTPNAYFMMAGSCNTYLDAADTMVVKIGVANGSKVIDLDGGLNMSFGGFLTG